MVVKCGICDGSLTEIFKIPDSNRGNTICVCNQCSILQLVESTDYDASKDTHSLRFSGERHIEAAQGAMWGNIRHGKGLRFDAHKDLLEKLYSNQNQKLFLMMVQIEVILEDT